MRDNCQSLVVGYAGDVMLVSFPNTRREIKCCSLILMMEKLSDLESYLAEVLQLTLNIDLNLQNRTRKRKW